jgi:prepilin-type N-terminal cleavage/methylation domain-containing protein
MKTGFTLIELMVVVAIVAVIAALAIPNLMQSRIRANEASQIPNLRQIATAQMLYAARKFAGRSREAGVPTSAASNPGGFTDNYRNLHYTRNLGHALGGPVNLLNQTVADAAYDANGRGVTATDASATTPVAIVAGAGPAFSGYYYGNGDDFHTSLGVSIPQYWSNNYAIAASPATVGTSGSVGFYLGMDGSAFQRDLRSGVDTSVTTFTATPANPANLGAGPGQWHS